MGKSEQKHYASEHGLEVSSGMSRGNERSLHLRLGLTCILPPEDPCSLSLIHWTLGFSLCQSLVVVDALSCWCSERCIELLIYGIPDALSLWWTFHLLSSSCALNVLILMYSAVDSLTHRLLIDHNFCSSCTDSWLVELSWCSEPKSHSIPSMVAQHQKGEQRSMERPVWSQISTIDLFSESVLPGNLNHYVSLFVIIS